MKNTWKYGDFDLKYYFKPEAGDVHDHLMKVNENVLKYGVFNQNLSTEELNDFYKNTMVCLISWKNTPIGFYYFFIIDEKIPLVHVGLMVIKEKKGHDIGAVSQRIGMHYFFKMFRNKFYISTITTVPVIVEYIDKNFSNVWPSPYTNLTRPPVIYKGFIHFLNENYVKKFFPDPEKIIVNEKRFVLSLEKRGAGFDDQFHSLSKASDFMYNTFCQTWLDYNKEEDLILIGQTNIIIRLKVFLYFIFLKLSRKLK